MTAIRSLIAASLASLLALSAPALADVYLWSQTPGSNSNSDLADDLNWVEGMAPSEVNDSARALMAEVKKWIDDQGGAIPASTLMATGGTANAQTLTTNLTSSALTHGWKTCFIVGSGLTNTGATTLNVDSLGAKAVQGVDGSALVAGELAVGTFHCVVYDVNDTIWLLENYRPIDATSITYDASGVVQRAALTGDVTASVGSNSTTIAAGAVDVAMLAAPVHLMPVGTVFDFASSTCPTKSLPTYGQCVQEASYTELFSAFGSADIHPQGCTGGWFGFPDLRGRVVVGEDDAGGAAASGNNVTTVFDGDVLGTEGGAELHTLTEAQTTSHTHSFSDTSTSDNHSHSFSDTASTDSDAHNHDPDGSSFSFITTEGSTSVTGGGGTTMYNWTEPTTDNDSHTHSVTVSGTTGSDSHTHDVSGTSGSSGSGSAHSNMQPSIVLLKCIYTGVI